MMPDRMAAAPYKCPQCQNVFDPAGAEAGEPAPCPACRALAFPAPEGSEEATQVGASPAPDLLATAAFSVNSPAVAPLAADGEVFSSVSFPASAPVPAPPPPAAPAPGERTLERSELNDDEFASMLTHALGGGGGDTQSALQSPGEGFVVVPKGVPPPLRSLPVPSAPPPLTRPSLVAVPAVAPPLPLAIAAPPPPPRPKVDKDPAKLLQGLAPIPPVSSLGAMPRLGDGVSAIKVLGLAVLALALGAGAGLALAPEPPKAPTSGPAAATARLAEARRLLSLGQDTAAMGVLETAITLDPRLGDAQRDLGVVYARQERFEDAARAYQAYLDLVPNAPDRGTVEATVKKFQVQK